VIRHSAPLRQTRLVRESSWSPGTETTPERVVPEGLHLDDRAIR
jgi:hypothetical protein